MPDAVAGGRSQDSIASQRASVGGLPGNRPAQKRASQFSGYDEKSQLSVAGARHTAPATLGSARGRRQSHPWLDYPPDFERKFSRVVGAVLRAPAILLSPLPPAVRFSLARNFGFVTKTFTQFFDKDGVSGVLESIGLGK